MAYVNDDRLDGASLALSAPHEQVVVCHDVTTGLRAVIAIHSTALGPALGGTRFQPYADAESAIRDVLRLAEAMTYKNALAGLDHGGGKAVILGDPATGRHDESMRAYGRFVDSLGGRYITACDVGTYVSDMDVVATQTRWVTGRSESAGGAGDSGVLTAVGVHAGMLAAAEHRWGEPRLAGRRVAVAGVGKVGRRLVGLVLRSGARVVVADVSAAAVDRVRSEHPEVDVVADPDDLVSADVDVFAPCALGGVLTREVATALKAQVVCGGANNQLATAEVADDLRDRGVTYCPDYVVNAGGVVQVADELHGFVFDRARAKALRIRETTAAVLRAADAGSVTPDEAARELARERVTREGRRTILPAAHRSVPRDDLDDPGRLDYLGNEDGPGQ